MQKIKQFIESEQGKDILTVLIVILVGVGSFELGRLSKNNPNSGIKIEYPEGGSAQSANVISSLEPYNFSQSSTKKIIGEKSSTGKSFFASNRGSKYYSMGCSAGKSIKQENRVYFTTGEEAEKAGYALSSSCR